MKTVIRRTKNGIVFICSMCNMIHFEYKNLNFNFESEKTYRSFANYFLNLDGKFWEEQNKGSHFRRKIVVPIDRKNLLFLLNNKELLELKHLFSKDDKYKREYLKENFYCFSDN